jgi:hypothetical protein
MFVGVYIKSKISFNTIKNSLRVYESKIECSYPSDLN